MLLKEGLVPHHHATIFFQTQQIKMQMNMIFGVSVDWMVSKRLNHV